jgi:hypothetical protein
MGDAHTPQTEIVASTLTDLIRASHITVSRASISDENAQLMDETLRTKPSPDYFFRIRRDERGDSEMTLNFICYTTATSTWQT